MGAYKEPHGGTLRDLYLDEAAAEREQAAAGDMPAWALTERQLCDLDLLCNGAFSPLEGFMTEAQHRSVCERMRLPDGTLWPIPILLDVTEAFAEGIEPGVRVALRDPEGVLLATMTVEDVWRPDAALEARTVYGTTDEAHPSTARSANGCACRTARSGRSRSSSTSRRRSPRGSSPGSASRCAIPKGCCSRR